MPGLMISSASLALFLWAATTSIAAPVTRSQGTAPVAPGPASQRLGVAEVVDRVQKRYDAAVDFRARFNQTLTNAAFKRKTSLTGDVLLKKPGRMRWNYQSPDAKMYLADGDLLWLYEPEDRQAFKQDLKSSQLPAALAFLTGKGRLAAEFDIALATDARVGNPGDYVLSLSPRQPQAQVKSILFVVDPQAFQVRESLITDSQGNTNDLLFSDIRINTRIPDATFRWTPPAGVRVIDAAKLGR
jgi:outer membrane lipoprotein carrier protein